MKPELCCLIKPEWKCSTCELQSCYECWRNRLSHITVTTYKGSSEESFCNKCSPHPYVKEGMITRMLITTKPGPEYVPKIFVDSDE